MTPARSFPLALAIRQLDDPAFLGVVARSVGLALAALLGLAVLFGWGGMELAGWWRAPPPDPAAAPAPAGWLGWAAGAAGVVGAVLLGMFLFVPLATAIATQFVDGIAGAVERRHYPGLPPARPASLAAQAWDGAALGAMVLAMQVLALAVSLLIPGLGLILGWFVTAWAIGRGLFMAVALRRLPRAEALAAYRARRGAVLLQGGLVAAAALMPGANLLAPVLGLAAMVHVLGPGVSLPGRIGVPFGLSRPGGA